MTPEMPQSEQILRARLEELITSGFETISPPNTGRLYSPASKWVRVSDIQRILATQNDVQTTPPRDTVNP